MGERWGSRIGRAGRLATAAAQPSVMAALAGGAVPASIDEHRDRAIDWLLEAHRAVNGAGFSIGYFLDAGGWQASYPETTGYLIPTLVRAARHASYRRDDIQDAASRSAAWLVNVQDRDGAFRSPEPGGPAVFDTGQVLFGLLAAHRHLDQPAALEAAHRAGRWLCAAQDDDGAWRRWAYRGRPHTYYAEVAWGLLELWRATGEPAFRSGAVRHLEWVLARQRDNGFFDEASFDDGPAVLHTIGYVVQGVYECGRLLNDDGILSAARRAADALVIANRRDAVLRAYYNDAWMAVSRSRCLTGLAQVAVVWARLHDQTGQVSYRDEARRVLAFLQGRQRMAASHPGLRGGLFGSAPVWGRYFPFRMPNWGVKFFVDVLLFARSLGLEGAPR